jgi:glyoxylase-like metal-dependent hydrolase (beta-lactamase superfamily II)
LIDSDGLNRSESLLSAIRDISAKPIKYVLNTHSHPDHTGGNKFFADMGATIISQENSRYSTAFGQLRFKDTLTLDLGSEQIEVIHRVSHTYDDVIIRLKKSNAIFMGDNLSTHAFLSLGEKGLSGHLAFFDLAISLSDKNTLVIPAHAAYSDAGEANLKQADLYLYKDKLSVWLQRLTVLNQQQLTIAEMAKDQQLIELTLSMVRDGHNESAAQRLYMEETIGTALNMEFTSSDSMMLSDVTQYLGQYQGKNNDVIEVFAKDNKVYARQQGNFMAQLVPINANEFKLKGYQFGMNGGKEILMFSFDDTGKVTSLTPVLNEHSGWVRDFSQTPFIKSK